MRHAKSLRTVETILFGILFLFFLQTISDFIEAIYAFGLLVTAFTVEIFSIILFFTPLLYLFFRKSPSRPLLLGMAYAAIMGRLLEPMLGPGGKLLAAGVSVGAFLLLFPALLALRQNNATARGRQIASGLAIALALSVFLRVANSGPDLSESGIFQVLGWVLALIAGILLWRTDFPASEDASAGSAASGLRITGLAIGLASVILMIYFALASPTVLARWTGYSYTAIVSVLVIILTIFVFVLGAPRFTAWLTPRLILSWNLLFTLTLVLTILPHQIAFPSVPGVYPLDAPAVPPLAAVPLFLMLVLSPILFIDFMLYARQISADQPSIRQLGGGFTLAALFFLAMVFFHVFTSIYDYAPVIGPLFRDRFWFVYLLAGLGLGLPVLLVRGETFALGEPQIVNSFTSILVGCLAILSVMAALMTAPAPATPRTTDQLKIMTYNIQQGYDAAGRKNLEGQLAVIRKVAPDVLGLQESDTARVANGNVDAVRYFADNLDMYSYYGPTTVTGTFGVALLSKYPIQSAATFFMYSQGEQTAAIYARIMVKNRMYQVFVTHLGNDGPMIQLQNVLARMQGLQNVIVMGDFNFPPAAEQYALITRTLADSWLVRWPGGKGVPGSSPDQRIDFIFVSPRTTVSESEYIVDPASDHPYLYSVIQP